MLCNKETIFATLKDTQMHLFIKYNLLTYKILKLFLHQNLKNKKKRIYL